MKTVHRTAQAVISALFACRRSLRHLTVLLPAVTVLMVGGVCFPPTEGPTCAHADNTPQTNYIADHIYLYDSDGSVRDVTATYNTLGYVFDEHGNRMNIVVDWNIGHVHDWFGNLVGFVYLP